MSQTQKKGPRSGPGGSHRTRRVAEAGKRIDVDAGRPLISAFIDEDGHVAIERVAESFGMSQGQLAESVGLSRETFHKTARANAMKSQSRIREMLEILSRVSLWAGGMDQAMAWYRAQPIAAFGGRTAEALVKSGEAGTVREYLDHLALGGFA
ncbi:MAG: antitoxin Xre/MbcA/ParS toxin-binding domain-containing protein [Acetobacteraceae bacterium]